jgi:hypothetical protein
MDVFKRLFLDYGFGQVQTPSFDLRLGLCSYIAFLCGPQTLTFGTRVL